MKNTKLPSCVDMIRRTSLGFPSWCHRPDDYGLLTGGRVDRVVGPRSNDVI